ncbi:MAG: TonB-dependent receptor [Rhizobacter sp.]|nr:TonB-dependent receptor [Rhizobacter sp.]
MKQASDKTQRGAVRWRVGAVAWALGVMAGTSFAQDLASVPLDQLLDLEVSAASKFALRLSESASSATVIGADEIRALGYRTLAEALQSVRGLVVSSDRTYSYLGVRGYAAAGDYNTRILLLIDGNRVNDTVFEQAFLGTEFPLDIDLVERIEFIPGQGSAVHGGNALFGVVNVVTRSAAARSGGDVSVIAGSSTWRQLRVSATQPIGEHGVLLASVNKRRAGGSDVSYASIDSNPDGGVSRGTDHERGEQLYLKYQQADVTATLVHADRTRGATAVPGALFGDTRNAYRDAITLADVALAQRIDAASLWKLRVYGGRYAFKGDYMVDYPPLTLNRDWAESRWWGLETNLYTQHFAGHKLVVGLDLQKSPRSDQGNIDVDPAAPPYLEDRRSSSRQSVFAEDQWAVTSRVSITAGLRYDRISEGATSSEFSPRVALISRPHDDVVLKLIHGRAFRAPNAYERYYAIEGTVPYKGNANLENERVRGTEAVLEYRPSPSSRWLVSAYGNRAEKLLMQTVDPADNALVFNNLASMRTRGLELEFERLWPAGARLRGNYSVQSARNQSEESAANHSVLRLGKLALVLPVAGGWTAGTQTVLVSRRGEVAGYGVTHLTLSRAWAGDRSHFSFSLYDVFDRRHDDPGSDSVLQPVTPQDGSSWRVELKLAF